MSQLQNFSFIPNYSQSNPNYSNPSSNYPTSNESLSSYSPYNYTPLNFSGNQPIQLNSDIDFAWNQENRIKRDNCAIDVSQKESQKSGDYLLSGYDPQPQSNHQYASKLSEVMHFQKVYRNQYYANEENSLIYPKLSNPKVVQQFFTPIKIGYKGPGTPSMNEKELESALQQGSMTRSFPNNKMEVYNDKFPNYQFLHEFGNPQNITHILPPPSELGGWVRGGDHTRDHVRRVDGYRRYLNKTNNHYVNRNN